MQLDSASSTPTSFRPGRISFRKLRWPLLGLGLTVVLGLCRFEVLWTDGGPMLLAKDRFTLAESFVCLDWINDAGTVKAKEKWPLTFAALNRDGIMRLRADQSVRYKGASPLGGAKGERHGLSR